MDSFFAIVYANPLYYIGAAVAVYGAFGFIYFLAGILSGFHHVILMDGHREHMAHYRDRVGVGLGIMLEAFMVWEIIRLIGDWLAGRTIENAPLVTFLIVAYILVLIGSFITGSKPEAKAH